MKDIIEPSKICPSNSFALVVKSSGNLIIDAPTITGSESKNAKSDATERYNIHNKPALIVTPNRLMPAKRAKL
jgi:hypothetical protein